MKRLNFENKSFIDLKTIVKEAAKDSEELIDSSIASKKGDLIVPSIYLKNNQHFECEVNLVQPSYMLTLASFSSHFTLFLEHAPNPFVQNYDVLKSQFVTIIKIPREDILNFKMGNIINFRGIKPKKTFQIIKNLGPAAAMGGLITGLIQRKLIDVSVKMEDDTIELQVNEFELYFKDEENVVCLSIACERFYEDEFKLFLKKQWINTTPEKQKEPQTKAEKVRAYGELFEVNDKVRVARFIGYDYGIIVSKEPEHASISINKKGIDTVERVNYWKLVKVRD